MTKSIGNIAVIGGSGFIGTCLVADLLKPGSFGVKILDKRNSKTFPEKFIKCDVRYKEDLISAIGLGDVIINLAAEHRDDVKPVKLYDEVNVEGARNIVKAACEKHCKMIIFTSSVAVYGFSRSSIDENASTIPANDYGRTKLEAENIFKAWQRERPDERTLYIIRPTVVFGEGNRGNVYSLLNQISSGRFLMIGDGKNRKSMAYVKNLSAFIVHCLEPNPGVHVFNYSDNPVFTMEELVSFVNKKLCKNPRIPIRLPYSVGYVIGRCFDAISFFTGRRFPISGVRVKKFCADSIYLSSAHKSGFVAPVPLNLALESTIKHEFIPDEIDV